MQAHHGGLRLLFALLALVVAAVAQSGGNDGVEIWNDSDMYQYYGCYNETTEIEGSAKTRALADGTNQIKNGEMTVPMCLALCSDGRTQWRYAGLEYSRLFQGVLVLKRPCGHLGEARRQTMRPPLRWRPVNGMRWRPEAERIPTCKRGRRLEDTEQDVGCRWPPHGDSTALRLMPKTHVYQFSMLVFGSILYLHIPAVFRSMELSMEAVWDKRYPAGGGPFSLHSCTNYAQASHV
jgi:hypothetical protein